MTASRAMRDLVIGLCPGGVPQPRLVAAVNRAGGVGVLEFGDGDRRARQALDLAAEWTEEPFGIRIADGCAFSHADFASLPGAGRVDTIVLGSPGLLVPELCAFPRVLVEVISLAEARVAADAGATGLIARGSESGGRCGELSAFVLLQRLLSDPQLRLPVWAAGGIGPRTAAASLVGGAAGVVLEVQLALFPEAEAPAELVAAVRRTDGSESGRPANVGRDGFLARSFADRFQDAGAAVRAVRAALLETVADPAGDTAAAVLRPGAALAARLGTTLPVLQGPMTRVSDRPDFAAAVAGAGALPFLALALAGPEQTRSLLAETADRLGDLPWGVGILGFAPDEIRSAQLEVIHEVKPAYVIIAGGRPSQAKALDAAGIAAFLHVPSPGLLEQFLKAGARRFVFEGSECGGHVGPRSSFCLWEAQCEVLETFAADHPDAAADLEVVFAGGIHDERSAAMVAALAAPLATSGAAVGMLMGTAYLFTEEAVRCGAIQPVFQQQVVSAEHTDLLETAPGHATRGVASQYTETFRERKEGLAAHGMQGRQMWELLEQLNVGRLRIASRGVQRVGAQLEPVSEAMQLSDGLFMAGQVATLRTSVTTLETLHHAVTAGAAEFHAERREAIRTQLGYRSSVQASDPPAPPPLDVAVVGMACVFPQSPDLAEFWASVLDGTDAITEVPRQRWDPDVYYRAEVGPRDAGRYTQSKWGGFLPPVPIDPLRYGIPPSALASIEPSQLLSLETARRALADAGYDRTGVDHSRTAVVFGVEAGSDLSHAGVLRTLLPAYLGEVPRELSEQLPRLTEDSFPGVLANVIAGRIANRLDLGGGCRRCLQGADRRHQRPGCLRRSRPAQRHQRLSAVLLRARALADRPLPYVRRERRRYRAR
jgi:NAD(P)H-dependent flavin oxidoreductase YrpB (nitropropane dioxygenase family)